MQILQIGIFSIYFLSIFNHLNSINFFFFYFIIRWSILGSTFLSKSLCIYNDIKKVIQYFWIDIFELIWNLIFPANSGRKHRFQLCNILEMLRSFTDKYTYPWLCKTFIMLIWYLSLWPEFATWSVNCQKVLEINGWFERFREWFLELPEDSELFGFSEDLEKYKIF